MEVEYGTEVLDSQGKILGTINHIIRDTWTGDIRKFSVQHWQSDAVLLLSPQDVTETTESRIILKKEIDWTPDNYVNLTPQDSDNGGSSNEDNQA
ncbi:MAG: PRC-barrel domain-containing protein [Dehalococcoidales bacterium]|nr:PRC-barrel domain-containing protein [Dehalococcoidales bacterium]